MAEDTDLKSVQCGFESHPAYVFKLVDATTEQTLGPSHVNGAPPFIDSAGNLHWFAYAGREMLSQCPIFVDTKMENLFFQWCKEKKLQVGLWRPLVYQSHYDAGNLIEYEFVIPVERGSL